MAGEPVKGAVSGEFVCEIAGVVINGTTLTAVELRFGTPLFGGFPKNPMPGWRKGRCFQGFRCVFELSWLGFGLAS